MIAKPFLNVTGVENTVQRSVCAAASGVVTDSAAALFYCFPSEGVDDVMPGRRILQVIAALLCAVLLAGCGAQEESLPQLVIGCDDYEPYTYTDADGEPAGMDVELAREACRRMGYEPVFKRIDWSQREALLADGQVDCLWSCFSMDGQEDDFAWVGPYMYSRQVVAVLESSAIQSLSDLEGKSIAVRVGTKAENIFLENTEENIPQVGTVYSLNAVEEISTALRNDYVDACAGYAAALREALNNDGVAYRFLEEDLSHAALGVAFAKDGDAVLREKLSAALAGMLADGTTKRILEASGVVTEKALGGLADA